LSSLQIKGTAFENERLNVRASHIHEKDVKFVAKIYIMENRALLHDTL